MGVSSFFTVGEKKLYCFADSVDLCSRLLDGGAEIIQLRAKGLGEREFYTLAEKMQQLIKEHFAAAKFIVNDHVETAFALKADGLHVGQGDEDFRAVIKQAPKDMAIGVSVKTVEQAMAAEQAGASYVGAGAVFPTATKPESRVIGLDGLRRIVDAVTIPVVAIGGIDGENIDQTIQAGASYCAIVSEINNAENIKEAITSLQRKIGAR